MKKKDEQAARSSAERVKHYDLLSSLAQADVGVNVAQLLRYDTKEAEALTPRLIRGRTAKRVMAAIEGSVKTEKKSAVCKKTEEPKNV